VWPVADGLLWCVRVSTANRGQRGQQLDHTLAIKLYCDFYRVFDAVEYLGGYAFEYVSKERQKCRGASGIRCQFK
jgi:hypothetical protein